MEEPVVNPWLGEQVLKLRSVNTDEELRAMYHAEQESGTHKSWEEFLCETALRAKVKDNPTLLEKRDDMPLSQDIKDRLYINQVQVLADLAQFTRETIEGIPGFKHGEKDAIYAYLESRGLPVRSCSKPVFFVFYPDTSEAYEQAIAYIGILKHEAKEVFKKEGVSYDEALKRASRLYEDALKAAEEANLDPLRYRTLVSEFTTLLVDNYQLGNQYASRGEEMLRLEIKLTKKVYGPLHENTCQVFRKAGMFYIMTERYQPAVTHFMEAIKIVKETKGEYDAEAGEDIVWVGFALGHLGEYQKALDMYMTGFELSLKFPGNPHIHPEPLSFEIGELYAKMGNKEKAREWMLKAEEYKTK